MKSEDISVAMEKKKGADDGSEAVLMIDLKRCWCSSSRFQERSNLEIRTAFAWRESLEQKTKLLFNNQMLGSIIIAFFPLFRVIGRHHALPQQHSSCTPIHYRTYLLTLHTQDTIALEQLIFLAVGSTY